MHSEGQRAKCTVTDSLTVSTKECFGLPALLRTDSHEVANPIGNVIETREPGGHAA